MNNFITNRILATVLLVLFFVPVSLNLLAYDETRDVKDFDQIGYTISGELYLEQGNTFRVVVSGSDNDVKQVITVKEGNKLVIKCKPGINNLGDVIIRVTLPTLKSLDVAGSGDVKAEKTFKTESIKLTVTGSGDVEFKDLQAKSVELAVTGSGDIGVAGKCDSNLKIEITGSGEVNSSEMSVMNAKVYITGSGKASVFASENLETNITGSGSVYYKGRPLINAKSTGSGSTKPL